MIEISKTDEDKFVQTIRILQGMLDEADLSEYEALKTAIKSLESWQFVIAEIESFSDSLSSRDEVVEGLTAALDIIENHLKEVNECQEKKQKNTQRK